MVENDPSSTYTTPDLLFNSLDVLIHFFLFGLKNVMIEIYKA